MELTEGQLDVLDADKHLLVTGGPGSGKTTISIVKAAQIAERELRPGQKILFLSFARATVSRVVEAIEDDQKISLAQKRLIDVETYHSFFWRILKTHGYLIGLPRRLDILAPPDEAIALSDIRSGFAIRNLTDEQKAVKKAAENAERSRIASTEGRVCFDFFAPYVGRILHGSERIRRLIAAMYPAIILDEFQDTNAVQWDLVQALGTFCRLIALADPEQRIYDWLGADPARLDHFRESFLPTVVDLSTNNHRSSGTEIAEFGNDLLSGRFRQQSYNGVTIDVFDPGGNRAMAKLVTTTYAARQRLVKEVVSDWSLAILVPTKKMTRLVSDAFRHPPADMTPVSHSTVIEMEAAILGAEIIAFLMQPSSENHLARYVNLLCNYFLGKGGAEPTQSDIGEAASIRKAYEEWEDREAAGRAIRKNSILVGILEVYERARALMLKGDPDKDWQAIRRILEDGPCKRLNEVAEEVRNIRIMKRGTHLRQSLAEDWRDNGAYLNALSITQQAFVKDHFATSAKPERGVVLMNMHKAKGKQFDEVIVFEGWPRMKKGQVVYNGDRIVRANSIDLVTDQARQNLRVSVTRARRHTTILTPRIDACVLLPRLT